MTFTEQLIKCKKGPKQWLLLILIWALALALATIALYTAFAYVGNGISGPFLFAVLFTLAVGWGAILLSKTQYIEYEYNVFEGGLDIDRITGKSKRVRVVQVSANKIEQLSPIAALDQNQHFDRVVMAAPSKKEANWFITYHSKKNGHTIALFAPSEELFECLYADQKRTVQMECDKLRKQYNV